MKEIKFNGKTYRISFDAMPESLKEDLKGKELKSYLDLLQKVQVNPRSAYQEVKELSKKHGNVPEVINLLTYAHIQNRKIGAAEKLIEETFEKHPDYLFARVNYADQCIRQKKLDKLPKLFPSFDLSEICPEKEVFHTSEFRGFMIMMTYYHLAIKDREEAVRFFYGAKSVEPHNPGVIHLEKKLFRKSLLKRLLNLFSNKK
ncbi:MAG: hypothetical protein KR126chlam1_00588 [Chlamydiae bacterium]|nr:hypothetical protein [Chlamydiota bacterium]